MGGLSDAEQKELHHWMDENPASKHLVEELGDEALFAKVLMQYNRFDEHSALAKFKNEVIHKKKARFLSLWKYAAAAVIILLGIAIGVRRLDFPAWNSNGGEQHAIVPGSSKAALVLENGERIELLQSQEGIVFSDSIYYRDGMAVTKPHPAQWVTVVTPKGGEYKLTLADGTKVWLNSDTEFKYQIGQMGAERKVFLNGEAYFEVTRQHRTSGAAEADTYIPFLVVSDQQEIKVLGTTFNVMAYHTEHRLETTLLEGKVSIYKRGDKNDLGRLLLPGQQARWSNGLLSVKKVDVEPYVSWKEGRFVFESQKLAEIMRTLERWYDIEVEFEKPKEEILFTGSMDRKSSFKDILDKIGGTKQVSFRIEGRRVIVM
ncbi:FecR family protein [Sphingobacterium paucimobilis]|nr:FecR family protein [Sphingobacterium paucimobilis]